MSRLSSLRLIRAALQAVSPRGATSGGSNTLAAALQASVLGMLLRSSGWEQGGLLESRSPWLQPCRHYSEGLRSATPQQQMPEEQYHKLVDQTLDDLLERLEAFVEDLDLEEGDVEYSQGVLTVRLGDMGTYVINKQTPNRQIWMSSPLSGPVRYDWAPGKWVYHRDGHDLHSRLSSELKQLTGQEVELSPCFACGKLNTCTGEQCSSNG